MLTTYHTNNTAFRRFTRNLYNGVWSAWREIPFVDQAQMNKVTQDNGDALIKVSDTETILDRVIASGAGFKTGEATGKTADAPTTSNTRLTINMVNATAGSVTAIDTAGVNYTRVISGSAWRDEWKRQPTAKEFNDLAAKVAALEGK
ncbi:pyocin knob domain-containing protein [Enterococcus sp. AZ020]|uniref:pyocin knob domain-containing protein n=1 Tax=Enterococcus sp. AZ020 TaxID=2774650 RepID=UPI003D2AA4B0